MRNAYVEYVAEEYVVRLYRDDNMIREHTVKVYSTVGFIIAQWLQHGLLCNGQGTMTENYEPQ